MWKITPTFIWRKLVGNSRSRAAARRGHGLGIESLEQRLLLTIDFDWTMPARFGLDANSNGIIDVPNTAAYAKSADPRFRVDLQSSPSGATNHAWTITGGGLAQPIQAFGRNPTVQLPEGTYTVTLDANENSVQRTVTKPVLVNDILIVGIGDSMAAGEGNPELEFQLAQPNIWADESTPHPDAHRSTKAYSAQAALALENGDPRSSVTYVNLAHTGATTSEGILGPFRGHASQLDEVLAVVGTRQIDALTITIGINDVNFPDIAGGLIARPLLLGGPSFDEIEAAFKDDLSGLDEKLRRVDEAIRSKLNVREVFLVQYPDPLRNDQGEIADNLFQGEITTALLTAAGAVTLLVPVFGPGIFTVAGIASALLKIDQEEGQWALDHVQNPIAAIHAKSSRLLGWSPVDEVAEQFRTHGYTASDTFFRRLGESLSVQGDGNGTLHPNVEGQAVIGQRLLADLRRPVARIESGFRQVGGITGPTGRISGGLNIEEFRGGQSSDLDGTVAGHEWDLDFRDGVFTVDATTASVNTPAFGGFTPRIVALRVTDNQGNVSDIAKRSVSPSQLALSLPPVAFLDAVGRLNVRGSNQNDTIQIEPGAAGRVNVRIGNLTPISFAKNEFDLVVVDALGGNDRITVTATGISTSILGGTGNDSITGGSGRDTIDGGDGNDTILGGSGGDTVNVLSGGNGDDSITGGQGNDVLDGNAGNDSLNGSGGDDSIFGNDGNDTISGNDGGDTINGNNGNDSIDGNDGNDHLNGNSGNDTLDGGFGSDVSDGGADDDRLLSNGETTPVVNGLDLIRAFGDFIGRSVDALFNDADIQTAFENFGEFIEEIGLPVTLDLLRGGPGNDTLEGGNGLDVLDGAAGNDSLEGGTGIDLLRGGSGNDRLRGGLGFDVIFGDAGNDLEILENPLSDPINFVDLGSGEDGVVIAGTSGNDQIFVSRRIADEGLYLVVTINGQTTESPLQNCETIFVQGGAGNDVIEMDATQGRTWKAVFIGGSGNDRLVGTDRGDVLAGGTGRDELIGGGGLDVLYQGLGGQRLQDENLASLDFFRRLAKRSRDR